MQSVDARYSTDDNNEKCNVEVFDISAQEDYQDGTIVPLLASKDGSPDSVFTFSFASSQASNSPPASSIHAIIKPFDVTLRASTAGLITRTIELQGCNQSENSGEVKSSNAKIMSATIMPQLNVSCGTLRVLLPSTSASSDFEVSSSLLLVVGSIRATTEVVASTTTYGIDVKGIQCASSYSANIRSDASTQPMCEFIDVRAVAKVNAERETFY